MKQRIFSIFCYITALFILIWCLVWFYTDLEMFYRSAMLCSVGGVSIFMIILGSITLPKKENKK